MLQNDSLNEMIKISFEVNLFTHWIFQIVYHSTKFIYSMSISHMLSDIKNDDEKFGWSILKSSQQKQNQSKTLKMIVKIHFMDVKKVYFHKIVLDN